MSPASRTQAMHSHRPSSYSHAWGAWHVAESASAKVAGHSGPCVNVSTDWGSGAEIAQAPFSHDARVVSLRWAVPPYSQPR